MLSSVLLCQVQRRAGRRVRTGMAEWRAASSALYEATPVTLRYLLAVASGIRTPPTCCRSWREDCIVISERLLDVFSSAMCAVSHSFPALLALCCFATRHCGIDPSWSLDSGRSLLFAGQHCS